MKKLNGHILIAIVLVVFCHCGLVYAQQQNFKFKHLTINDGLSQNAVQSIYQDSKGYMWFGTKAGLNKYDGYNFTVYKSNANDATSISNSTVTCIYEDTEDNLLVGTYGGGINIYNRDKDNFTSYQHDPEDTASINGNFVECIYEDKQGNIWIGTTLGINLFNKKDGVFKRYKFKEDTFNNVKSDRVTDILEDSEGNLWVATQFRGLGLLDRKNKTVTFYKHDNDPESIASDYIWTIYEDRKGNFWVGTYGQGLDLFDRKKGSFEHFSEEGRKSGNLGHNHITMIYEDTKGRLWIGSDGGGLSIFDRTQKTFTHYQHNDNQPYSIGDNVILDMYEDPVGTLWIGTLFGGVSYNYKPKFKHYKKETDKNGLSHNVLAQIYGDSRGYIWIGTDHGGLNRFDPRTNTFKHFRYNADKPGGLSSDIVLSITEDDQDNMWFGTFGGGINVYDTHTKTFRYYKSDSNDPNSLASDYIGAMLKDSNGNIWIGVPPLGLNLYNPKEDNFTHFRNVKGDRSGLSGNIVVELCETSNGQLWVGTSIRGLNVVDIENVHKKEQLNFKRYLHVPEDSTSLSNNQIRVIFEDSKGNIWVGTNGGGLNLFHRETSSFTCYYERDGLPSNVVQSILEDDHGNLWISTNRGLSKFDPEREKFKNYDISDGLQSYEFSRFSSDYKSKDGKMYFGGVNGFNVFHPDSLHDNTFIPPVVLTNFTIFNKQVSINQNGTLNKHFSETRKIVLNHDQTVFSFEFAALNYISSEKNEYTYKLEGFDREWNYVGTNRTATYTNLDPGTYTFRVRASNNDGHWNEEGTSIKVIILPPWWETWWFKTLVFLTITGAAFAFYIIRMRIIQRQKTELQRLVKEKTTELKFKNRELIAQSKTLVSKNKELDQFAYIVSHDLKAPLRGINSLSEWIEEDLEEGNENEVKENIKTLRGRVARMKNLIDGILEYSRAGRIKEEYKKVETYFLVKEVISLLEIPEDFAIEISNTLPKLKANDVWLAQVFSNLISNAIKYHDKPHGNISIDCIEQDAYYEFSVADDGPGIPDEYKIKIFGIFQTLESRDTRESTGVGLAIVKKIVEEQGGQIWVESVPDRGSKFIFTIPKHVPASQEIEFESSER